MGLVGEWKRGGANTVKSGDCVVKGRERVCERSRGSRGKEAIPQQESVVTIEIHDNFEGDIGIGWLPVLPFPFRGVEFRIAIQVVNLAIARENFPETLQWAEDREVGEETVGWWIARRS